MKYLFGNRKIIFLSLFSFLTIVFLSCNKMLDSKVYSVVQNENYWKTSAQINAGIAPAYNDLRNLNLYHELFPMWEGVTSDEMIVPTRGGDWGAGGIYLQEWLHTWLPTHPDLSGIWNNIFGGIGNINFISSIVNGLPTPPSGLDQINAELNTLRAYYYYLAMDNFGNVPIVKDFKTDPNTVTNSSRQDVYNFIESEIKASINQLPGKNAATYGRATKWMAHCVLAKLYLNAQVYTGTPRWALCMAECDSIINSGEYSLQANYFDNFSVDNENSVEDIFNIPIDAVYTGGLQWQYFTLHYQNNINFQLLGGPWNGGCSTADYYYGNFDTSSSYTVRGENTYRTFSDSRTGQYLVGAQFSLPYSYPPNIDVLVGSKDLSLEIKDIATGLPLIFNPRVNSLSDASAAFRLAGARNIKYFPSANQPGQSNDWVVFRLADIMLMKAEAEIRSGVNLSDALNLVNKIRERAYGNDSHNWLPADLTLDNLLAERAREMSWECYRRQDLIRYEVAAGGKLYFGAARNPGKTADPDKHYYIFPIPQTAILANSNLKQNPGY